MMHTSAQHVVRDSSAASASASLAISDSLSSQRLASRHRLEQQYGTTSAMSVTSTILDYSDGQEPICTVKPAHRPLHAQVTLLLQERESLLQEIQEHRLRKEDMVEAVTFGLRADRDKLAAELKVVEGSRGRIIKHVVSVDDECKRLKLELREQKAMAEASRRESEEVIEQLKQRLAETQTHKSENDLRFADRDRRLSGERRRLSMDVAALQEELSLVRATLQRAGLELEGERGAKDALDSQLSRLLDERQVLKERLTACVADRDRLTLALATEQRQTLALRAQLNALAPELPKLRDEHARALAEEKATGSRALANARARIAELEAICAEQERRLTADYLLAADERSSCRKRALHEEAEVKEALAMIEPLRKFLQQGGAILAQGASAANEMRWTHEAAGRREVAKRAWQAVTKAGEALDGESNADGSLAAWLMPMITAAKGYATASLALTQAWPE